jgi:hydrogenase nickel incorporation protein HypA/HybF
VHELAITQSVIEAVCEIAGKARVTRVRLEIGSLSGVVAESLRFCFDLCAKSTVLEGAALQIHEVAGRARCFGCNAEFVMENLLALCDCGSANVEILAGQELRIKEVELQNV